MGSGLDTRGAVDGFMRGFNFVDGYYDKEDDRARRDRMDQEQRDYRTQQQTNWQQSFEANEALRQQQQSNADRTYGLQVEQGKRTAEHQEWTRNRYDRQDSVAAGERQHKQNIEYVQQAYNNAANGVPFDDRFYQIVSNPRYANLDPRRLLSPEMGVAIEQGKRVMDPSDPASLNDPESIEALNYLFDYDINSDRNGNPLEGKRRLVGGYPGMKRGTIVGELELWDGRMEPMTEGRGSAKDGDNTVLQQPVEPMVRKLAGADMMRQFLQTEQGKAALVNMGRAHGLIAKPEKSEYQLIQSPEYNEFGQKIGENPSGVFDKKTGNFSPFDAPNKGADDDGGRALMESLVSGSGVSLPGKGDAHQKPTSNQQRTAIPTADAVKADYEQGQRTAIQDRQASTRTNREYSSARDAVLNYLHTPASERDYGHFQKVEAAIKSIIDGDYPDKIRQSAISDYRQLLSGTVR